MADLINSCFGAEYGMGNSYGWLSGSLFIVAMVLLIIWLVQQISKGGKYKK